MKNAIFSISTPDYMDAASVALDSFGDNCSKHIDKFNISIIDIFNKIYDSEHITQLVQKYKTEHDKLRWTLKSAILLLLLESYDNVIYIDSDIYFVNNSDFLITYLDKGILLTKHNRPLYPSQNNSQFLCNFTDGFFNAGFIGASRKGIQPLSWLTHMNRWSCRKDKKYGLFDDQKYLDMMALEYNHLVRICDHPGCNLATWNTGTITRSFINNEWIIGGEHKPIFCHFSCLEYYPPQFDPMLSYYYTEYSNKIKNLK